MSRGHAPKPGEAIGRNVQGIRTERSWTQDEAARRIRGAGLPWTRSNLAALEAGRREDVTLTEFIFLCVALDVAPDRLLEGDGLTQLGQRLTVPLHQLRNVLHGEAVGKIRPEGSPVTGVLGWDVMDEARRISESAGTVFEAYRDVPSAAEVHAAGRLGIDPADVYRLSVKLWQHGLDEERESRLAERGTPMVSKTAHRGHVTRELLGELRGVLRQQQKGGGRS